MSGPSLLTIPRELRDLIYGNLHHSVPPRWVHADGNKTATHLGIDHAPIVNVLFINRQIYREYWDTSIQSLSAIIDWRQDLRYNREDIWSWPEDEYVEPLSAVLISQLRNVVIIMTDDYMLSPHEEMWQHVEECAAALRGKLPQLATVQVILRYRFDDVSENNLMKLAYPYNDYANRRPTQARARTRVATEIESRLTQYPSKLAGLPLKYRGHGHYVSGYMSEDAVRYVLDDDPDYDIMDEDIHALNKLVSYVYTLTTPGQFFHAPELWSHLDYLTLPDGWVKDFDEKAAAKIRAREYKMLEWTGERF